MPELCLEDTLLRVQFPSSVWWQFFSMSGGCDQSVCVAKWGVEFLFKFVSFSEALSDQ